MLARLLDKLKKQPPASKEQPSIAAFDVAGEGKHGYSPDAPISTQVEDRFQRWPFAERVAHTLAVRPDPSSLVVGIYGPWGDGKTSTIRMMEEALRGYPKVAVTAFNPWQFDSEDLLLRGFFDSLAQTLGRSLPTKKEEIGAALAKYGFLLAPVGGSEVAKGVGGILSKVNLDELRERVEQFLEDAGLRVIVMIDDIDRLDRREIQAMLRLVKLTAGFRHVSYVLAFDDEIVAAALGERYGEGNVASGHRFLEKIVQVPLHLPPADSTELRNLAFEGVDQALKQSDITLTEDQGNAFGRHFVDALEFELTTPRKAKLYSNALLFALPLLKGESNVVDLMLIEGIRVYYPKLYRTIRENPELFAPSASPGRRDEGRKRQLDDLLSEALDGHPAAQKEAVRSRLLEVLFPRTSTMGYGSEWDTEWAREQRICSSDYFPRYFTYAVPRRDVSDLGISELLDLAKRDAEKAIEKLHTYSMDAAMPQLIRKLRRRAEALPADISEPLASILAQHGNLLPREKGPISSDWTFMQTAILIAQLLRNIADEKERTARTKEIVATASPLPFAFECLRWIRVDDAKGEPKRIVSKDVEDKLGQSLASRVATEAAKAPLYRAFGGDTPRLLWAWDKFGEPRKVSKYLEQSFEKGKDEVLAFLASYIGLAWGMESGLPHKADLARENYDAVAKLVPPDVVMAKLRVLYGNALDDAEYLHGGDVPFERRIALQFAHIHAQATKPKPKDSPAPA